MISKMTKIIKIILGTVVGLAVVSAIPWLWYQQFIELPPVAVRTIGRVAGVMNIQGTTTVRLPIKFHRQEHSLSCEIATLKMALSQYGDDITEDELIGYLPFDTTPKANGVWGDPNVGFVGDIDGKMFGNGYGVYWDPIARVGLRYRRTEVIEGASASDLAGHLAQGRPIIIWGYFGRGRTGSWVTPSGKTIQAINGEHTRVVTGFNGPLDAPTSFSLIDPITGQLTWSIDKFMTNWASFNNSGVVVYPKPRWVRAAGQGRVWEISPDGQTRHQVPNWQTFVSSGGYKEAIVVIDKQDLSDYKIGPDIKG